MTTNNEPIVSFPQGAPKTQSFQVSYTLTLADTQGNGIIPFHAVLPSPYQDSNYLVWMTVESVAAGNNVTGDYANRTADGFDATFIFAQGNAGDLVLINVLVIHN